MARISPGSCKALSNMCTPVTTLLPFGRPQPINTEHKGVTPMI